MIFSAIQLFVKNNVLNLVFITQLSLFCLIITGILPRETAIFLAIGLAIYVAVAPIEDAVAIAAPQIGVLLRIFVVSGRAFIERDKKEKTPDEKNVEEKIPLPPELVCINPEIIKLSI